MSSCNLRMRDTGHLSIRGLSLTRAPPHRLKGFQGYNYTFRIVRILRFCTMYCVKSDRDH